MREFIRGKEEAVYEFTKHSVEQLKQTEGFNKNHLSKVLVEHMETTFAIIDNLLENDAQTNKTSYNT